MLPTARVLTGVSAVGRLAEKARRVPCELSISQPAPMSPDEPNAWTKVRNMPWTVSLELRRRLAWPLVRAQFAWHGIEWGMGWKVFGRPIIQSKSTAAAALHWATALRFAPRLEGKCSLLPLTFEVTRTLPSVGRGPPSNPLLIRRPPPLRPSPLVS